MYQWTSVLGYTEDHDVVQIEVRLGGAFQRKYTVKGLMPKGPADLTFFNEQDGKEMSVAAYYEERYNIRYLLLFLTCPPALCCFGNDLFAWSFCLAALSCRGCVCSIKQPQVPCINVGTPTKPVWLPPEVCWIVEGQRRLKLDE